MSSELNHRNRVSSSSIDRVCAYCCSVQSSSPKCKSNQIKVPAIQFKRRRIENVSAAATRSRAGSIGTGSSATTRPAEDDGAAFIGLFHHDPRVAHASPRRDARLSADLHVAAAEHKHHSQRYRTCPSYSFSFFFFFLLILLPPSSTSGQLTRGIQNSKFGVYELMCAAPRERERERDASRASAVLFRRSSRWGG